MLNVGCRKDRRVFQENIVLVELNMTALIQGKGLNTSLFEAVYNELACSSVCLSFAYSVGAVKVEADHKVHCSLQFMEGPTLPNPT